MHRRAMDAWYLCRSSPILLAAATNRRQKASRRRRKSAMVETPKEDVACLSESIMGDNGGEIGGAVSVEE
jgi:hypothetical protein